MLIYFFYTIGLFLNFIFKVGLQGSFCEFFHPTFSLNSHKNLSIIKSNCYRLTFNIKSDNVFNYLSSFLLLRLHLENQDLQTICVVFVNGMTFTLLPE